MPTDTILMLVTVVAMFAGFLVVLAWGDAQTPKSAAANQEVT